MPQARSRMDGIACPIAAPTHRSLRGAWPSDRSGSRLVEIVSFFTDGMLTTSAHMYFSSPIAYNKDQQGVIIVRTEAVGVSLGGTGRDTLTEGSWEAFD